MDATAGVFVCYKKRLLKRLSYREGKYKDCKRNAGHSAYSLLTLSIAAMRTRL